MKTLVIYDSNFGNTKLIASEIAKNISKDAQLVSINNFNQSDLRGVDLLIVGSPIIGWRPTEKMSAFLKSLDGKIDGGFKFTSFDTRVKLFIHGDAKDQIAKLLANIGGSQITTPKEFFVKDKEGPLLKGEVEKAAAWAKEIISIIEK